VALRDGLAFQIARAVSFDGLSAGRRAGDPGDLCSWDVATAYWTCVQVSVPIPGFSTEIEWEIYQMDPVTLTPAIPLAPLGFALVVPRASGGKVITYTKAGGPGVFNTTAFLAGEDGSIFQQQWGIANAGWTVDGRWVRRGVDTLALTVAARIQDDEIRRDIDFTLDRVEVASRDVREVHLELRIDGLLQPVIDLAFTAASEAIVFGTVSIDQQEVAILSGTVGTPTLTLSPDSRLLEAQLPALETLIEDLRFFEEGVLFRVSFGECVQRANVAGCSVLEP